jgi:hypothetical protein
LRNARSRASESNELATMNAIGVSPRIHQRTGA